MVKTTDTCVVIFCSLLQLTTSWADDDSNEHIHIKLHLPEVVKKHTHMKMIYKHHFHPKKVKFQDHHIFDELPLLERPFRTPALPDLFNFSLKSQIIDIKKPKIKFPKFTEWNFETGIPTFPTLNKLKHGLHNSNNFHIKFPDFDDNEEILKHGYQKFSNHHHHPLHDYIEDDDHIDDEILPQQDLERIIPSDLNAYDSNYIQPVGHLHPQWSSSSSNLDDQDVQSSHLWPIYSGNNIGGFDVGIGDGNWANTIKYHRYRDHSENDDKIMQAFDAFPSTKLKYNDAVAAVAVAALPFNGDGYEKNKYRLRFRGTLGKFRKNKMRF